MTPEQQATVGGLIIKITDAAGVATIDASGGEGAPVIVMGEWTFTAPSGASSIQRQVTWVVFADGTGP